jgi:tetratricopeptide (TPR) repeat protein
LFHPEIAENFKNQATERHQLGQLRDALGFYTQGIEAKPDDRQLRLSLLLNRAACNLSLGNYGSVLRDTGAALTESPNSPKAYFRAASALLALSRWNDALDCISRGKGLVTEAAEDKQKTWEGLEAKARKGLVGIEERTERERRDRVGKEALRRALQVSKHNERQPLCLAYHIVLARSGSRHRSDPLIGSS